MNIVLTVNGKFYAFDLARQLRAQGVHAQVFTSYPRFKVRAERLPAEDIHTFPWWRAPYMAVRHRDRLGTRLVREWEWQAQTRFDAHVAQRLPRDIDVLVAMSGSGLRSGRAAQAQGARYVCDRASSHIRTQDRIVREEHERWGLPWEGIDPRVIDLEEAEYAQADAIVVPSRFVARSFQAQGFPTHKVHCIPLGVDLSSFKPMGEPDPTRFDVLFVAGPQLRKGLPYLLQAYRKLTHPRKSLTLVGQPMPALISRMKQLGIWVDEARMVGVMPFLELKQAMSRSHVLALPSVEEGLSLVQAQAMACGTPVIGTRHSGAEDLFEDGVEGYIVPIRDSDALADRLQWMADHPQERAEMGRRALAAVQRLGGWRDYGMASLDLYRRLTGGTGAADGAPSEEHHSVPQAGVAA